MDKKKLCNFINSRFNTMSDDLMSMMTVYFEDYNEQDFSDYNDTFKRMTGADKVINGVSKLVLFFEEYPNYVFKIPFQGYYSINECDVDSFKDAAESNCVPEYFNTDDIVLYNHANGKCELPIDESNYCEAEEYFYRIAKKNKISSMFAKTQFLCTVGFIPIYVSNRVESKYSYNKSKHNIKKYNDIANQIVTKSNKKYNTYSELHSVELSSFIADYGINAAKRLIDFINKYNISDFHDGNFGYDKDGRIKIIDYSGFNDDEVFG